MAGRLEPNLRLPADANYLGYLPDAQIPTAIACADVIAVVNRASAFGDYSYPIKLYEAMAMGIPAVASATESTRWILRDHPQMLVEPDDADALASALRLALSEGLPPMPPSADWIDLGEQLTAELELTSSQARSR